MCHSSNNVKKVLLYFRLTRCTVNKISILYFKIPVSDIVPVVRIKINDTNKISRLAYIIFLGVESKVYVTC